MLEPHEFAAAMGFDADDQRYEFAGTKIDIIRQIGNAVPVATLQTLVRASICRQFADEQRFETIPPMTEVDYDRYARCTAIAPPF